MNDCTVLGTANRLEVVFEERRWRAWRWPLSFLPTGNLGSLLHWGEKPEGVCNPEQYKCYPRRHGTWFSVAFRVLLHTNSCFLNTICTSAIMVIWDSIFMRLLLILSVGPSSRQGRRDFFPMWRDRILSRYWKCVQETLEFWLGETLDRMGQRGFPTGS